MTAYRPVSDPPQIRFTTTGKLQAAFGSLPSEVVAAGGESGSLRELFAAVLTNTDLKLSTAGTYRRSFPVFAAWFSSQHERHDAGTLIRYKGWLEARQELSAATKSLYLNAARVFYRRLFELGALDRNYAASVRSFQPSGRHKRTPISDVEIERVFQRARVSDDLRLQVLLNLLYRQGLRRQEVVGLRVADIDFAAGQLFVLGKGRDDREPMPLHPLCAEALKKYLGATNLRDGYLFPSRKNKAQPITGTRLYQLITGIHEQAGVTANVHAYRKAFTSKLIDAGMNLLNVQQFTRHRSLGMLRIYYDRIDQNKTLPLFNEALS